MPFIEVPNAAEVTLRYQDVAGRPFSNTLSYVKETPFTAADLLVLCSEANSAWVELMESITSTQINYMGSEAVALDAEDGFYAELPVVTPIAGTRSGSPTPLSACAIVTFRTGERGRSARGRFFHTGLIVTDLQTPHTWKADSALAVQNALGTYAPAICSDVTGAEHCVISRQEGNVVLAEGVTRIVTSYVGRTYMGTQRGRVRN